MKAQPTNDWTLRSTPLLYLNWMGVRLQDTQLIGPGVTQTPTGVRVLQPVSAHYVQCDVRVANPEKRTCVL